MSDAPGDMRKMMAQLNSEINASKKNSKLDKDKDESGTYAMLCMHESLMTSLTLALALLHRKR
jgi:hypothetical protein